MMWNLERAWLWLRASCSPSPSRCSSIWVSRCSSPSGSRTGPDVTDIVLVAIIVGFFLAAALLVRVLGRVIAGSGDDAGPGGELEPGRPKARPRPGTSMLEPSILRRALGQAFVKLDPRKMVRIPVMFVVEIGSVVTAIEFFASPDLFVGLITLWLWATVLFANFAEAVAEGRGKAQADTLRRSRQETVAFIQRADGTVDEIPSAKLQVGDLCVVKAGQVIPGDGDVVAGLATVDESAITGESAPVIRESGGDRSAVTGGTVVLSDQIVVRVTSNPGETFLDRMFALVGGASRQRRRTRSRSTS